MHRHSEMLYATSKGLILPILWIPFLKLQTNNFHAIIKVSHLFNTSSVKLIRSFYTLQDQEAYAT